jgi:RNA polymerase sigma-70 factor (ECF subfamily)
MTVLINSMPLAVGGQRPRSTVKAFDVQIPASDADDQARRLAASVARGDEIAFVELYDRYHKRLFGFALALGQGDETLAHETVQSTFLTAAAKLRSVQGEEHLWNWLANVARQHLGKTWRQRQRDAVVVSMADVLERANLQAPDHVLEEKLDAALLSMQASERQLIEWFYFNGLSHKEMGERLGATPKAASSRLERARAKLRTLLTQKIFKHET